MTDTPQAVRRSWWQIVLHPWLALFSACLAALFSLAVEHWQLKREAAADEVLISYRGWVMCDDGWLRKILPESWSSSRRFSVMTSFGDRVVGIIFRQSREAEKFQDKDLWLLEQFSHLREVDLANTRATLTGLHSHSRFTQFEEIGLGPDSVDNETIELLKECRNLRCLTLVDTGLSDSTLTVIREIPTLRKLAVSNGTFSHDALQWFHGHRPDVSLT